MESFAQLFEESLARQEMRQGEVITAEVVLIDHNFVVVNAGLKSESYVPLEEFLNDQGELEVKVGDFVQVAIEMLEDGYGATRLSRDRAKRIAAWNDLDPNASIWSLSSWCTDCLMLTCTSRAHSTRCGVLAACTSSARATPQDLPEPLPPRTNL